MIQHHKHIASMIVSVIFTVNSKSLNIWFLNKLKTAGLSKNLGRIKDKLIVTCKIHYRYRPLAIVYYKQKYHALNEIWNFEYY